MVINNIFYDLENNFRKVDNFLTKYKTFKISMFSLIVFNYVTQFSIFNMKSWKFNITLL